MNALVQQALSKYGQRLQGVRAELVSMAHDLEPATELGSRKTPKATKTRQEEPPDDEPEAELESGPQDPPTPDVQITDAVRQLAMVVRGICGILVRVIDSIGH
jgi:hypothetical protein